MKFTSYLETVRRYLCFMNSYVSFRYPRSCHMRVLAFFNIVFIALKSQKEIVDREWL
uniref:Uncharacterized protein n=1 Tax=Anguilla anguilla TaxID=7936 RepID=A0A0E9XDJ6_ANGAN